tara:strand:- start:347 stop:1507 length:1161 start_codon:yes stop_codon:yes gene_type:complete
MGLNATVTPGINVTSSTTLDAANLNLLGTPTVSITGSIDSSDIGQNTVGTSEIQANAVTQTEIGSIGGTNYILRGDSSGNGAGISTLAQDGGEDQISLLVNDKTDLKARMITGDLDVTTVDGNKLNLAIKDNSISAAMLQDNVTSINIGNIEPGGGLNADGGKASVANGGAGLIVFNPGATSTIGDDTYYGKAQVLQPTRANQVIVSSGGESSPLAFGTVPGMPDAFVHAYSPTYRSHVATSGDDIFTKLFGSGVYGIKRKHDLTGAEQYGVMLVVFDIGLFAADDNVGVIGNGINGKYEHAGVMPLVHGPVQVDRFNESLTVVTDTEVEQRPFIYVKWMVSSRESGTIGVNNVEAPQDQLQDTGSSGTQQYFRNVNVCNMTFYKY